MRTSNTDSLTDDVIARERTATVGAAISVRLSEITQNLTQRVAGDIAELKGDKYIEDLLLASIESNLDTVLHVLQHDIDVTRVHAPACCRTGVRAQARAAWCAVERAGPRVPARAGQRSEVAAQRAARAGARCRRGVRGRVAHRVGDVGVH